jgi:hypothetical protein
MSRDINVVTRALMMSRVRDVSRAFHSNVPSIPNSLDIAQRITIFKSIANISRHKLCRYQIVHLSDFCATI